MRFFSILKASLAKLAFWGKPRVAAMDEADVAPPPMQRDATASPSESLAPSATTTPAWFTRLKHWRPWRRIPASPAAVVQDSRFIEKPTPEQLARIDDEVSDATSPSGKLSWLRRLKTRFALPRKSNAEDSAGDQSSHLEKQATPATSKQKNGEGDASHEAEELPPVSDKRFKRILVRLRNKWVWIPATSIVLLALITTVVVILAQSAHEREKLKAELQIAKKKLEQKSPVPVVLAKISAPVPAASATETKKTEPLIDPVREARAETNPGINAGDCVVKDKTSVAQNLKNCIEGFNSAMANSPTKTRTR
jgi:hypothetical protein